ncbi:hypothetical protein AKJ16_DCAP20669 [Drosera capensis]
MYVWFTSAGHIASSSSSSSSQVLQGQHLPVQCVLQKWAFSPLGPGALR